MNSTASTRTSSRTNGRLRAARLLALVPIAGLAAACTGGGTGGPGALPGPDAPAFLSAETSTEPTAQAGTENSSIDAATASNATDGAWTSVSDLMTFVINDVHEFWAEAFTASGYETPYVKYWWTEAGERVETGCVDQQGNVSVTNDLTAEYCPTDDQIIMSTVVAENLWSGADVFGRGTDARMGDFAVAYVVAHEYAHNVQTELGYYEWADKHGLGVMDMELHADCFAGVWANSSYYDGQLEAGDVEEALAAADRLGTYDATDPGFHGTPEQRVEAFSIGYDNGSAQYCNDVYLAG